MGKLKKITALCTALSLIAGCGVTASLPEDTTDEAEEKVEQETPARAQDDFYRYINEDVLKKLSFRPGEVSSSGAFDQKIIEDQVKGVVSEVASGSGYEKGTEEDIIKTAYDLYSAYDFESSPVPTELDGLLREINDASSVDELLKIDAKLQTDYNITNLFNINIDSNYFSPEDMILVFQQYHDFMGVNFTTLEDTYSPLNSVKKSASAYYSALGHDKDISDEVGTELGHIAMDIYNSTDQELLHADMTYNYFKIYSLDEMQGILPSVDLVKYIENLGIDSQYCGEFAVYDPAQLESLGKILTEDNLEALKAWKMASLGSMYQKFIANGYDALKDLVIIDYDPRETQIINEIYNSFPAETDPIYVEKYYSDEADNALISLCDRIKTEYRVLISGADWLNEATRQGLLNKLEKIEYVTGADSVRHDASEYASLPADNYFEYFLSYKKKKFQEKIELLKNGIPRDKVLMNMQTFNACYNPSLNNITITVAIMNGAFFDLNADFYTNLGGIGMVIAHEMGHGFDNSGVLFDENGKYNPGWVGAEDTAALEKRNSQAVDYFEDNFTVLHVYHVDGEQTLGENYADLGAMECISSIPETDEQRKLLFENYARIWCTKKSEDSVISQIDEDVHSPEVIRVNAILSTVNSFYETYGLKEGDGMFIPAEKRISRWH
ncbi:M13 family metallopeptidase [Butyrivibrio sp. VCD2006]|uniref:M13 family metallopeptidase n=1 Tax=Butyrivibrio sp. VCD2006 TaxID=1280664 RepID=UPI0003F4AE2A|nr:M13 family metallopeptidase [Butyrivibrio sp. VCD2006]